MSAPLNLPSNESLASLDRDALAFASTALRAAVRDGDEDALAEWFRPGFLLEVANIIDSLSRAIHGVSSVDGAERDGGEG